MSLLIFDLFVRFVCLCVSILGFSLAWEFGFLSGDRKDCLRTRMINLFLAIAWFGLAIFIGGAVSVLFVQLNITGDMDTFRIIATRLIAVTPVLVALYQFRKFIIKTSQVRFSVGIHRMNGKKESK